MSVSKLAAALLCVSSAATSARAQDQHPMHGGLYDQESKKFLQYHCEIDEKEVGYIDCSFIEMTIRKGKAPTDEQLNISVEGWKSTLNDVHKEMCKQASILAGLIADGSIKTKKSSRNGRMFWSDLSDVEKKDLIDATSISNKYCKSPSRDGYIEMMRGLSGQQTRTCWISTEISRERFEYKNSKTWQSTEAPWGVCGRVRTLRFEGGQWLWKLYKSEIMTNRRGDEACVTAKDTHSTYDFGQAAFFGCDYLQYDYSTGMR